MACGRAEPWLSLLRLAYKHNGFPSKKRYFVSLFAWEPIMYLSFIKSKK